MCRLFGLLANKEVDIRFSMLEADKSFKELGSENPHGWGIGWYGSNLPKVEKHGENAFKSTRFDELAKEIKSKIVIAHVRYATSGSANSNKNAHPFVYNNWIFAHNGTINESRICELLSKPYNTNFTSEPIDSEIYFRFLIQCINQENNVVAGIKKAVGEVVNDCNGANFVLSDGEYLYAFKFGKTLCYLERNPKSSLHATSEETKALIEAKALGGEKAVLIASERLTKSEKWIPLKDGDFIIVKENLQIEKENIL